MLRLSFLRLDASASLRYYLQCGTSSISETGTTPSPLLSVRTSSATGTCGDAFEPGSPNWTLLAAADPWKLEWTGEATHYWLYVFPTALRPRLLHWGKFLPPSQLKQQRRPDAAEPR